MKPLSILAIAVLLLATGTAQESTSGESRKRSSEEAVTYIKAELIRTLDAKKMAVGDPVLARTTEDTRLRGDVVIPKNAKLIGRVKQVQVKGRGTQETVLAIVFEKALMRDGREVPLALRIEDILAAESASGVASEREKGAVQSFESSAPSGGKVRRSSLNGIDLDQGSGGDAQASVLRSDSANIRIESGARMLLRVIQQ